MSTIDECLAEAVRAGKMKQADADEYGRRLKDAQRLAEERGLAGTDAWSFATTEAARKMVERATSRRAMALDKVLRVEALWADAGKHKNGIFRGLETVLGLNIRAGGTAASIENRRLALYSALQRDMAEFLGEIQTRVAGLVDNKVLPDKVLSALYGRETGDALAKRSAEAWSKTVDRWVDGLRAAGVPVGRREDWRLPQKWDPLAVRQMGQEKFVAWLEDMWRRDHTTGEGLRLHDWAAGDDARLQPGRDDDRVREILETAYRNITTDGADSIEPGVTRTATLADRYGRRRVMEWTSDKAYREFNDTAGVGQDNLGELMHRHIEHMARDLAIAQTLGADPDGVVKILLQMAAKNGVGKGRVDRLDALWFHTSGKAAIPMSQTLALAGQALRSGLTSAQLGGAILASTSDLAFTKATASWNGLSFGHVMMDAAKGLSGTSKADRIEAMRRNLILEVGLRGSHDAARDVINDIGAARGTGTMLQTALQAASRVTGRAAEFVIRAQGLGHWTQVIRDALGKEFQAHFHDLATQAFDVLPGPERRFLDRYGITAADWNILRTKALDADGFMDAGRLAWEAEGRTRDAALKFLGGLIAEQRIAVPEGNAVTKAFWLGKNQPGTPTGEALRSMLQYKGFSIATGLMHGWRAIESLSDAEGQWFRGEYMASMVIMATAAGAVSLQLKNVAAGKDPEPMFDMKANPFFWAKAAAQGSAGGIIGDYLKAFFSTRSSADASRLVSPAVGLLLDMFALSGGNIGQALEGQKTNFGTEAVRFGQKYLPSVWYTRLAMDRLVWATLQKMVDPDAASSFQRMQDRAMKEQGTQFWWRPGAQAPARGPDLARAGLPDFARAF